MQVSISHAKAHFSRILQLVAKGEEVVIVRAGVPVARLVPMQAKHVPRPLGMDRNTVRVAEDFDAPMSISCESS
jgi:prevent-host-death family protein